jgi:hypothetical protein
MSYPDLDAAREHHAALKEILRSHAGGRENREAVRQVQALCRAASAAVEDAYCRETLGIVGDYASHLYSDRKHRKWDRAELPGAEFLRLQILHALDSLHSRLWSLEVIRRAGASSVASSPYRLTAKGPNRDNPTP